MGIKKVPLLGEHGDDFARVDVYHSVGFYALFDHLEGDSGSVFLQKPTNLLAGGHGVQTRAGQPTIGINVNDGGGVRYERGHGGGDDDAGVGVGVSGQLGGHGVSFLSWAVALFDGFIISQTGKNVKRF